MNPDRRQAPRKALRTHGLLASRGSVAVEVQTIDVSVGGMCVGAPSQIVVGQTYTVTFDVMLSERKRRVAAVAEVAYSVGNNHDGFKTGLRFIQIDHASVEVIEEYVSS